MRQALGNLLKRIGETLSAGQRKDYEKAASRIVAALDSGKLKSTDEVNLATPIIDAGQPGWLSPLVSIRPAPAATTVDFIQTDLSKARRSNASMHTILLNAHLR